MNASPSAWVVSPPAGASEKSTKSIAARSAPFEGANSALFVDPSLSGPALRVSEQLSPPNAEARARVTGAATARSVSAARAQAVTRTAGARDMSAAILAHPARRRHPVGAGF